MFHRLRKNCHVVNRIYIQLIKLKKLKWYMVKENEYPQLSMKHIIYQ